MQGRGILATGGGRWGRTYLSGHGVVEDSASTQQTGKPCQARSGVSPNKEAKIFINEASPPATETVGGLTRHKAHRSSGPCILIVFFQPNPRYVIRERNTGSGNGLAEAEARERREIRQGRRDQHARGWPVPFIPCIRMFLHGGWPLRGLAPPCPASSSCSSWAALPPRQQTSQPFLTNLLRPTMAITTRHHHLDAMLNLCCRLPTLRSGGSPLCLLNALPCGGPLVVRLPQGLLCLVFLPLPIDTFSATGTLWSTSSVDMSRSLPSVGSTRSYQAPTHEHGDPASAAPQNGGAAHPSEILVRALAHRAASQAALLRAMVRWMLVRVCLLPSVSRTLGESHSLRP